MLAALCLGVVLVGIELFITAVALPRIFLDLSGWAELRRASWIITAYLVAEFPEQVLAILERDNPSTTVVVRHTEGKRHDVVLKLKLPVSAEKCTNALQQLNLADVMRAHKDERVQLLVMGDGITMEPLPPLKAA